MKKFLYGTLLVLITIAYGMLVGGCSEDGVSSDSTGDSAGTLLVSRVSVALVPGATETIFITANNTSHQREAYSVQCTNPEVVTYTYVDSILTITAVTYGTTSLTITSLSGSERRIPVEVYNHSVLNTGELLIAFVDTFEARGSYTSNSLVGSFWHPLTKDGYVALGSMGLGYTSNPNGKEAMMVVKANDGSDALAHPLSFRKVYQGGFGAAWRPVPPEGYVALGDVAVTSFALPPSLTDVVCVREDLTVLGEAGAFIWKISSGSGNSFIAWEVAPPDVGPHEFSYLQTGTFMSLGDIYGELSNTPPLVHPAMHVLKVPLPLLAEAPYHTFQPKLTGYDSPPGQTMPLFSRALLVPHTIIKDSLYAGIPNWGVHNSPFYRLEREVFYKLLYHNNNQTSEIQTNEVTIRSGVTTTESNSYWSETAVSISFEAGISIGVFESKISTTVSETFGYQQQTSVAVLQEKEVSTSINTPPGKAAALWQKFNRYVLKRHNGGELEAVATWEFGSDSYVTNEYPKE